MFFILFLLGFIELSFFLRGRGRKGGPAFPAGPHTVTVTLSLTVTVSVTVTVTVTVSAYFAFLFLAKKAFAKTVTVFFIIPNMDEHIPSEAQTAYLRTLQRPDGFRIPAERAGSPMRKRATESRGKK